MFLEFQEIIAHYLFQAQEYNSSFGCGDYWKELSFFEFKKKLNQRVESVQRYAGTPIWTAVIPYKECN